MAFIFFLNGKAFILNKTNKTYIVEWNFQAVTRAILRSLKNSLVHVISKLHSRDHANNLYTNTINTL
jgi:hypothetical protein